MIKEILEYASSNVDFTSFDIRRQYPHLNKNNITRALKILSDRGTLRRWRICCNNVSGPIYRYKINAFVSADKLISSISILEVRIYEFRS